MKTIYLQNRIYNQGAINFESPKLHEKMCADSNEVKVGQAIVEDAVFDNYKDAELKKSLIPIRDVTDFQPDLIYLVGGLLASKRMWKIPEYFANKLLDNGIVIIVADVDKQALTESKFDYTRAERFIGSTVDYGKDNLDSPMQGADEEHFMEDRTQIVCYPGLMTISDWLQPIYQGVEKIIVSHPVKLAKAESILVSGNNGTTGILQNDTWVNKSGNCPFGSVSEKGNGYVVFIGGKITRWCEFIEGNRIWIMNIAKLFQEEVQNNREMKISQLFSKQCVFLAHLLKDNKIVQEVADELKEVELGIWLNKGKKIPSNPSSKMISEGFRKMTHFVLFWSKTCHNSSWIDKELNHAIPQLVNKSKPIIIVRLDRTPLPPIISDLYRIEADNMQAGQIGKAIIDSIKRIGIKMY